jgi:hypothetical protein
MNIKKILLIGSVPVFVLSVLAYSIPQVNAATLNVNNALGCSDSSGSPAYCTIQAAVNVAVSGDTIDVASGTYIEDDTVNKSVTIDGATGAKLVVADGATSNGFDVTANNVTIEGFDIDGPVSQSYLTYPWSGNVSRGIVIENGFTNFTITNNTVQNLRNDILIDGRNTGSVTNNTIDNSKSGISVQYTDGTGITITGNKEGQYGNDWGMNLHLNGCYDSAASTAGSKGNPPCVGGVAPDAAQTLIKNLSVANGGWTVQDQAYASSNRTAVTVSTTGAATAQGDPLGPINTIQNGVNAVVAGGTVNVAAGTYDGGIGISQGVILDGPNLGISPNTGARVAEAVIDNGSPAIRISTTDPVTIDGFTFSGTGTPIDSYTTGNTPTIEDNIIENTISGGNLFFANSGIFTFEDNQLSNLDPNSSDGMQLAGNWDGATGTVATITGNVWKNSVMTGVDASDVSGNISDNTFSNISMYGLLIANNSSPLVVSGNTFANITNPATSTSPTWGAGIRFYTPALTRPVSITGNTFTSDAIGVAVRPDATADNLSTVAINGNTFSNDTTAVFNDAPLDSQLNATGNWWGAASGPLDTVSNDNSTPDTNASGTGSPAIGAVNYANWCVNSSCIAPPSVPTLAAPSDNATVSTSNFSFTWNPSTDTTSITYELESSLSLATNPDGSFTTRLADSAGLTTTSIDSPGTPNGTYYWHVRAADAAGNTSAWSDTWTVTVNNTPPSPSSVYIHVAKYLDGVQATSANASGTSFPMVSTWTAANLNGGVQSSGSYALNPGDSYEAVTSPMNSGANYATNEVATGPTVGASCSASDPFALVGYSTGASLAIAASSTISTTTPNLTGLTGDEYVIVWNSNCLPAPTPLSPANRTVTSTAGMTSINWNPVTDPAGGITYVYQSSNSSSTNSDGSFVTSIYTSGSLTTTTIPTLNTPAGVYYWQVKAIDADGNVSPWSAAWMITVDNTPAPTVYVTTDPATNVSSSDAMLNGTNVDDAATGHSLWVSTSTFSTASPNIPSGVYSTPNFGAITASTTFSAQLSSLTTNAVLSGGAPGTMSAITASTTYYYVAWSLVNGTWYPGAVMSFTTAQAPYVTTDEASGVATSTATVKGTNGPSVADNTSFWWGTTPAGPFTAGGNTTEFPTTGWSHDTGLGTASVGGAFNEILTGLTPSTTYYYAAWSEIGGVWYPGDVMTFTTPALGSDDTLSALGVSAGSLSPSFNSATASYTDLLPYNISAVPTVTATTTDPNATEVITPAANTTGTATVAVTAQNGATQDYTVAFSLASPTTTVLNVIVNVDNSRGGSATSSDFTVNVIATNPNPTSTFPGNAAGTEITIDPNTFYGVNISSLPNYTEGTLGSCNSGGGGIAGDFADCTITEIYTPALTNFALTSTSGGGGSVQANIGITNVVDSNAPATGSTIHYTLTVSATGPSTPVGLVVNDVLPAGLTFVSASSPEGSYNNSTGVWTPGSLNVGQNATLTITATVTASAGTAITNVATVSESSGVINSNVANDSPSVTINVSGTSNGQVLGASTSTRGTSVGLVGQVLGASTTNTVALLQELQNLEQQLVTLEFKTNSCSFTFNTNLSKGMTSADVQNLQKVLNYTSLTQVAATGLSSPNNETTYFGDATKNAVIAFQNIFANQILTPNGLTSGNGYVGASTRSVLNGLCSQVGLSQQ